MLNSSNNCNNLKRRKLAFVHIPKSAGVSAEIWFYRMLGHKYSMVWANSWRLGMNRDWLPSEIHMCLHFSEVFIHNHSSNWMVESLEKLKEHDFFVFAWIRDCPYNMLCSFYFFFRGMQENYQQNEFFKLARHVVFDTMDLDLDKWLLKWGNSFVNDLPMNTYRFFDYFKVYSDKNFGDFIEQQLGIKYYNHRPPIMHMNKSENQGWKYYREKGIIADGTEDYLAGGEFVTCYNELLVKANE